MKIKTIHILTLILTITVNFGCSTSDENSPVNSISKPPVVTDIPDQIVSEGTAFVAILLDEYVDDPDNDDSQITWTFDNTGNLQVSQDLNRVATVTPRSVDWHGIETIIFTATDPGKSSASDTVSFEITPVNDEPIITVIPNQKIYETDSFAVISLDDYLFDVDNEDSEISWTFRDNTDLSITIDSDHIVTIEVPDSYWTGYEFVIFRAVDPEGLWDEDTVLFKVRPIIYTPLELDDWPVSTPLEQGLDPDLFRTLYRNALRINYFNHIYSVLVIKNGYLIAENYYNGKTVDDAKPTASATKSFVSALVGIALDKGLLTSLDQKIMAFFPELDWASMDPRKSEITIRHMLKMRSGYPTEEYGGLLEDLATAPERIPLLIDFPLAFDPDKKFGYSNLTAHILGMIVRRVSNTPLADFAQEYLFDSLGYVVSNWPIGIDGYYVGYGDVPMRPRDMAKFGSLYLNKGVFNGTRILPIEWIEDSFQPYSFNVYGEEILENMTNINYGYLWWSATSGDHSFDFAWGNGGQLIILLKEHNMIIVTTAYHLTFDERGWQRHKLVLEMVGEFITSLP